MLESFVHEERSLQPPASPKGPQWTLSERSREADNDDKYHKNYKEGYCNNRLSIKLKVCDKHDLMSEHNLNTLGACTLLKCERITL